MVLLNGIHGSGKSFLCDKLTTYGIPIYSASHLIAEYKNESYTSNKFINHIEDNQLSLIEMVNKLECDEPYVLDGHLCLLDGNGEICRINREVIIQLNPKIIITKVSDPNEIFKRLKHRDKQKYNIDFLKSFQYEEIQYAKELSEMLKIKLMTIDDDFKIDEIVEIIRRV